MKPKPLAVLVLLAAFVTAPASAQEPAERPQTAGNASPRQPAEERPRFTSTVNVRVELTVTDTMGPAAPQKKTVSMLIADGQMGRIRAQSGGPIEPTLNVDATPNLMGDRVRLQVSLEYHPPRPGSDAARVARVTELVTVLLDSGKPIMISQSADPAVDRKVTVEVTATILK